MRPVRAALAAFTAAAAAVAALSSPAVQAAEVVLDASAVTKLLMASSFKREGKLDLQRGACWAYLEQPTVRIDAGRVHIRSRLEAYTGLAAGGQCLGVRLASWTQLSAVPVAAADGVVRLHDLRIDQVDDPNLRTIVQSGLVPRLPQTLAVDVRSSVARMLAQHGGDLESTLERFAIELVEAERGVLSIRFDFRLSAK